MEDVMLAYSRLMEEIREELMQECFLNSLENQSYEG
jgi:hypothetical protein